MAWATTLVGSFGKLWPRFGGALLTVCAVAILELASGTALRVPNPPAILLLTTVYSTFSGGLRAGLISAAVSWLYLAYFFDNPGPGFAYTGDNLRRFTIWAVSLPAIVVMIGILKRRAECASDEIVRRERERSGALETALAERRRSEESLRALFDRNLAGMFRSRRDGRALECNADLRRAAGDPACTPRQSARRSQSGKPWVVPIRVVVEVARRETGCSQATPWRAVADPIRAGQMT